MRPDLNALRVLIDRILAAHDGCCLDDPNDRIAVAEAVMAVLVEYLGIAPTAIDP